MNKTIFIVFICLFICGIKTSYASDIISTEEVEKINIKYTVSPWQNTSERYGYNTSDKNEIKMLAHYINSFEILNYNYGYPTDTDMLYLTAYYTDGTKTECRIYSSTSFQFIGKTGTTVGIYEIKKDEYNRFIEFIKFLRDNQIAYTDDVTYATSDWAEVYIDAAIADGLVPEWNQINYTGDITRLEVTELIANLLEAKGIDLDTDGTPFSDTTDADVIALYSLGIISGKTDTEFCPYDTITREEFAKILNNTCTALGIETSSADHVYADAADISDWAQDSVAQMYQLGLMCGNENNEFKPLDSITKEEVIVAISRLNSI